jgi:hypothetical protein
MIISLGYDDILQVFMQKVMLTQNEIENTFKSPVRYEVETQTQAVAQETPASAEMQTPATGEVAKPKVNPLTIIIGVLLLL